MDRLLLTALWLSFAVVLYTAHRHGERVHRDCERDPVLYGCTLPDSLQPRLGAHLHSR
jgi:hypothetical protein